MKMTKPIIVGHPASIRLGLICILCKNVSKSVLAIEKMTQNSTSNSFQDHPLWIDGKPWTRQRSKSESSAHSSKVGNLHGSHKSGKGALSKPPTECAKKSKTSNKKATEPQNVHKKVSSKTIQDGSKKDTSLRPIVNRVNKLNPRYMVPADEVTRVISDPKSRKKTPKVTEQPSSGPPPPGS